MRPSGCHVIVARRRRTCGRLQLELSVMLVLLLLLVMVVVVVSMIWRNFCRPSSGGAAQWCCHCGCCKRRACGGVAGPALAVAGHRLHLCVLYKLKVRVGQGRHLHRRHLVGNTAAARWPGPIVARIVRKH